MSSLKRWQEYTEVYKKDLHDGVITHLEPDILECEVKWALGRITTNKASGRDGIPVELFQILKHLSVTCCESAALNMPANLENSAVATGLEKVSFNSSPKERQCQRMIKSKVKLLSCVWLLVTPWTIAHQGPPPMGFSRQEYWNGLPSPSPKDDQTTAQLHSSHTLVK